MSLPFATPRRVKIGDAAAFVGITPRTIRHYHEIGLLPEPERGGEDALEHARLIGFAAPAEGDDDDDHAEQKVHDAVRGIAAARQHPGDGGPADALRSVLHGIGHPSIFSGRSPSDRVTLTGCRDAPEHRVRAAPC